MPKIDYNIFEINDPAINSVDTLSTADTNLVDSFEIKNVFIPKENFVEVNFYSLQNTLLLSDSNYNNYKVLENGQSAGREGAFVISVDVIEDVKAYGYSLADVRVAYNFLNNIYSNISDSNILYVENISPDRLEVRFLSTKLTDLELESKTLEFKKRIESSTYFNDFSLYSGNNNYLTAINIDVQDYSGKKAVIVKLYEPLPNSVQVKDRFTVVEKLCDSPAYEVVVTITPDPPVIPTLRSANFNIEVEDQPTEPSQYFNYNELFSFPVNNSYRELNSLFNEKGAELGIDYSDYGNFINFSSAEERVRNFKYKLQLIESYQGSLDAINNDLTNYNSTGITGSREYFEGLIKGVVNNFDHYERHLYYESGSDSWPKGNSSRPYINVDSTAGAATTWFNNQIITASNYDTTNPDILINSIPSYLREDSDNDPYILFVHMTGQHFDNLWVYTDAVSKKYDGDNRLTRGVPKGLVEDLLKNFGVKLYTSNKSAQDLFRYFTANSYELDDLEPNLEPIITGSNYAVSQKTYQQEIYKRIYHNLPLLMKSKGTERGLRALINCFGIPSDVFKIRLYGGQSSEELPFFGGEQPFTGSLDKVRLNNTGSIASGSTLSQYTSIIKSDNFFTQDLHTIEVGFSPTHNVDNYILSQSAVLFPDNLFDIDDYIGDPREISTNTYFSLRDYADTIFAGVNAYDLKDFVRFIKFFDNVIFKMVRDFIPARVVADTGIIIKPHLLERSKYKSPAMSWTRPEYTGSIDTAFATGSSGGVFESNAIGSFSGSLITSHTETVMTPSGSRVHAWTDSNGNTSYVRGHEEARFDGQLSGSHIVVSDGEWNRNNPYKKIDYKNVKYNVRFLKDVPANACIISSLASNPTPFEDRYVVRPSSNPYQLAELFENGTVAGFDYYVNNTLISPPVFDFGFTPGTQYDGATIKAVSRNISGCEATTYVVKVACDFTLNLAVIPETYVYTDIVYNLAAWFIPNSNTLFNIYVNGVLLTEEQFSNYNFTGSEGDLVDVKFEDAIDPSCFYRKTLTIRECSLSYYTGPVIINYPQGSDFYYFYVKEHFVRTNPDTIYKLLIRYELNNGSGDIATFGPVDIKRVLPPGSPGEALLPLVPVKPNDLKTWYGQTVDYPQGIPDSIPYTNYRSVAFTARNTTLCTAGTPNLEVVSNPSSTPYTRITGFRFNPYGETPFACDLSGPNKEVWILGSNVLTPEQVIVQGLTIYNDENGIELAPAGGYASYDQNESNQQQRWRTWDGSGWIHAPYYCT